MRSRSRCHAHGILMVALWCLPACRASPTPTNAAPGMDLYAKDLIDAVAKVAGLLAVGATLLTFGLQLRRWQHDRTRGLDEQQQATVQRRGELRWKQAAAAKALNDEMLEDPQAGTAFRLLDYPSAPIKVDGTDVRITPQQILQALDPSIPARDPTSRTIREAFDSLFYYLATMEHYEASSLVLPVDVAYPLDYYHWHFERLRAPFDAYVGWYGLERTAKFLAHQRERLRLASKPPAFTVNGAVD